LIRRAENDFNARIISETGTRGVWVLVDAGPLVSELLVGCPVVDAGLFGFWGWVMVVVDAGLRPAST